MNSEPSYTTSLQSSTLLFSSPYEPDANSRAHAVRLLREASTAGVVAAKHQLGLAIIQNPDLAHSSNEAVLLLNEAAADGFWKSSVVLGILSRDGRGMAKIVRQPTIASE